jgi:hypothetical protein
MLLAVVKCLAFDEAALNYTQNGVGTIIRLILRIYNAPVLEP